MLVVVVSASVAFIVKRRSEWIPSLVIKKTDKQLPAHMVFQNTDTLPDELDTAALLQQEVMDEFAKLEQFVAENIEPVETYETAEGENVSRNRYKDILPYDSNMVTLSRPTGKLISKASCHFVW